MLISWNVGLKMIYAVFFGWKAFYPVVFFNSSEKFSRFLKELSFRFPAGKSQYDPFLYLPTRLLSLPLEIKIFLAVILYLTIAAYENLNTFDFFCWQ